MRSYRSLLIPGLVVAALLSVLLVISQSILHSRDFRGMARVTRESAQLKSIASALAAALMERKGGSLPPDIQDHAALCAWMLHQNLIASELLISPVENHSTVTAWAPEQPFAADLSVRCNTSFAMPPLDSGKRFEGPNHLSSLPLIGRRGPRHGDRTASPYAATQRGLEADGWSGPICFWDAHVEYCRSPTRQGDCLFQDDTPGDGPAKDIFLVIQKAAAAEGKRVTDDALSWD